MHTFHKFGFFLLFLLFIGAGCLEEEQRGNSLTEPVKIADDPGPGNLVGTVIGTIFKRPLAGVTVSAGGVTTTTGADGTFRLNNVGDGHFGVMISGDQVYTRIAAVNTTVGRVVTLDAIEVGSDFHLGFYRELARGNHPYERDLLQTHRWTSPTPPTIYIDTDASVTFDGVIEAGNIARIRRTIPQIIAVFTGGLYTSASIREHAFSRLDFDQDIPENAIVISFDDRLIYIDAIGLTETEPDFTSPTSSTISKVLCRLIDAQEFYGEITMEELVAHELGHGFGFRHTSVLPSVMVAAGAFGGLYSDADRRHMAIMYSRPAGNTDLDNDPLPGAKTLARPLGRQVFIEQARVPTSPEWLERVRTLPDKRPDVRTTYSY